MAKSLETNLTTRKRWTICQSVVLLPVPNPIKREEAREKSGTAPMETKPETIGIPVGITAISTVSGFITDIDWPAQDSQLSIFTVYSAGVLAGRFLN